MNAEAVFKLSRENLKAARRVIDETAVYLGIAMTNIVMLFNPEMIFLGGGVGRQYDVLITPI